MGRTHPLRLGVLVLVASGAAVGPAWATGQDLFGVGASNQAMVGTGAARGPGYAAAHTNPALLGGQERSALVLGFRSASFDLEYRGSQVEHSRALTSGLSLGMVVPLAFGGPLENRLAVGMSVYSPRSNVARAELWFADRPQFPLLTSQADSLGMSLGLGVRLPYELRVGAGLRWLAGLSGSVVASSDEEQEQTFTTMNTELEASLAPVLGATYQPHENFHLGFVWRDELESDLDVTVTLADLGTLVLPPMHLAGVAQYEPEQYELEGAYHGETFSFILAARYRLWSHYPGVLRETVRCTPEEPCGTDPVPDPGYENTVSPRGAAAFRIPLSNAATGELRAGVGYEPSPAPEQTGLANQWDNARLLLSAGYGVRVESEHNAFFCDLAVSTQRLRDRRHTKNEDVSSDNAGFPKVKTGGHIELVSLELGVEF